MADTGNIQLDKMDKIDYEMERNKQKRPTPKSTAKRKKETTQDDDVEMMIDLTSTPGSEEKVSKTMEQQETEHTTKMNTNPVLSKSVEKHDINLEYDDESTSDNDSVGKKGDLRLISTPRDTKSMLEDANESDERCNHNKNNDDDDKDSPWDDEDDNKQKGLPSSKKQQTFQLKKQMTQHGNPETFFTLLDSSDDDNDDTQQLTDAASPIKKLAAGKTIIPNSKTKRIEEGSKPTRENRISLIHTNIGGRDEGIEKDLMMDMEDATITDDFETTRTTKPKRHDHLITASQHNPANRRKKKNRNRIQEEKISTTEREKERGDEKQNQSSNMNKREVK